MSMIGLHTVVENMQVLYDDTVPLAGVSDCDCTRSIECNIDGRLSGASNL